MDTTFSFPRKYSAQVVQGEVGLSLKNPHLAPFVKIIHYNAPITPGSSGGPVVNDQGELIGVTRQGSGTVAFSIAAEYVQKILESN
jgi:S1-C subfamily serine protease